MRVLVVATSRKTRGGISAVLKLYEKSPMWRENHCLWIGTHRDGCSVLKMLYLIKAFSQFIVVLPFYDIVHIHLSLPVSAKRKYPFFLLAKIMHKPIVLHLHCGTQIDEIWSDIYQKMFQKCDCAIILSESLKKIIERHIRTADKIKVVYNPCPEIVAVPGTLKKKSILFSGTIYEGKGYKDLIKAFSLIFNDYPDWTLIFLGNGEIQEAQSLCRSLNIEDRVQFLGWVAGEKKENAFRQSSIFCLPSYAEGFPMAVLDALAYGLPIITTPVGGIPDIAVDGQNMLLFNPGDVESLARKLSIAISDEALCARLSAESLFLSYSRFSLKNITQEVSDIYHELVSKDNGKHHKKS